MQEYRTFALADRADMQITRPAPDIWVVDGFYRFPLEAREFALGLNYKIHRAIYDTYWTESLFKKYEPFVRCFEALLETKITEWHNPKGTNTNGSFQYITSETGPVIHSDGNTNFGGVLFLTPDAPPEKGIAFFQNKALGITHFPSAEEIARVGWETIDAHGKRDLWRGHEAPKMDAWTMTHSVPNRFNRLVLFNSKRFHSGMGGFGSALPDSRLYQTFFFS